MTGSGSWGEQWSAEEVAQLRAVPWIIQGLVLPSGLKFIDVRPDGGNRAILPPLTTESLQP
jgi:hypothetical protein